MKQKRWAAIVIVAVTAAGVALAISGAAHAQSGVTPAIDANGTQFYSPSQIDAAWQQATENYPEALPEGVRFPATAPGFFHDATIGADQVRGWEVGFPETIAAQYWRCAWLYSDLHPSTSKSASAATTNALSTAQLTTYASLPGVKQSAEELGDDMASIAARLGVSPAEAEYQVNCGPNIYVPKEG